MIKKGAIFLVVVLVLVIMPLTSAGFFSDFFAKITGEAITENTSLNITIGNSAPTITFVEVIPAQAPQEGLNRSFEFNFTADDTDGASTINKSSAQGRFQRTGEPTRLNTTCVERDTIGTSVNFTCTINMTYFDENGAWTINVTIKDNNDASGENSSESLTYNLLTAMILSPTALGWPGIGVSDTNTGSDTDPITLNNTGNDVDLSINVTGRDLEGEDTNTEYIFAENLTVENTSEGCSGTVMVNVTSTNVTSSILQRGENALNNNDDTSGQEQIFFCLVGVVDTLSAQSYSSAAFGAWVIDIIT